MSEMTSVSCDSMNMNDNLPGLPRNQNHWILVVPQFQNSLLAQYPALLYEGPSIGPLMSSQIPELRRSLPKLQSCTWIAIQLLQLQSHN